MTRPPLLDAPEGWLEALAGHVPPQRGRRSAQVAHLAERFDTSTRTVWRWVRSGRVPRAIAAAATGNLSPEATRRDAVRVAYLHLRDALGRARAQLAPDPERVPPALQAFVRDVELALVMLGEHVPRRDHDGPSAAQRRSLERLRSIGGLTAGDGRGTYGPAPIFAAGALHEVRDDGAPELPTTAEVLHADALASLRYSFSTPTDDKPKG